MDKWRLCSLFFFVHSKSIIACCTTHNFHQAIFILQKWLILFHQVSIVCATFFLTSLYSIFTTLYLSRCPACMMTPPPPSTSLIFSASSSSSSSSLDLSYIGSTELALLDEQVKTPTFILFPTGDASHVGLVGRQAGLSGSLSARTQRWSLRRLTYLTLRLSGACD